MRLLATFILLLTLIPIAAADWLRERADIMGTRVTVELFHADPEVARRGADAVLGEMRRIDSAMSPYIDSSELARLNASAHRHAVQVSEELYRLIERSIEFSEMTHGAFDITFASVGFLYDYRNHVRPADEQLERAAGLIDYHNVVLDEDGRTVSFSKPGVRIDLGGIAKGYAVDRCIESLRSLGIHQASVSAGGDSRVIGERWGRPWNIGVRDPRDEQGLVAVIPLQDVAVSTSGDYERYFEEGGVRYHHIINPASGRSAREVQSVTIIGPDALTTDALSTSVFVLGVKAGLELIERLPGIDAIIVDRNGTLHYSSELEPARKPDTGVKSSPHAVTD